MGQVLLKIKNEPDLGDHNWLLVSIPQVYVWRKRIWSLKDTKSIIWAKNNDEKLMAASWVDKRWLKTMWNTHSLKYARLKIWLEIFLPASIFLIVWSISIKIVEKLYPMFYWVFSLSIWRCLIPARTINSRVHFVDQIELEWTNFISHRVVIVPALIVFVMALNLYYYLPFFFILIHIINSCVRWVGWLHICLRDVTAPH